MTHKKRFPSLPHGRLLLAVVLCLIAPAFAEWKEKVLYSFQGGANDGAVPAGGVVFDRQGNLYGATTGGGPAGTVFQLGPPAHQGDPWTETLIYQFQGEGSKDGSAPNGGLIVDAVGNLYGVTAYGGTGDCLLLGAKVGCGTVYEISPPKQKGGAWTRTILYSFPTAKQGYLPTGNLVFDRAGNLYGATSFGGTKGTTCDKFYGGQCGVVFKLSPPKTKGGQWTEKVLHGFAGIPNGQQQGDGANPNGGLVLDSKGTIYGTTYIGGYNCPHSSNQGCGTVFELKPSTKRGEAWVETVLHRFRSSPDGVGPAAGVTFDGKGNLYCTTVGGGGGNFPSGTVVQLMPHSKGKWAEKVLYSFQDNGDGGQPRSGPVFDTMRNLYGTATGGGTVGGGTIFRLRPIGNTWSFTALYEFAGAPDGSYPSGDLTIDKTGNLWGTTQQSGNTGQNCGHLGCGVVFEVSP